MRRLLLEPEHIITTWKNIQQQTQIVKYKNMKLPVEVLEWLVCYRIHVHQHHLNLIVFLIGLP